MDAKKIAVEGIERALVKVEEVYSELHVLHQPVSEKLRSAITQFSIALTGLLTPDGLARLRSRITTANAMKPTQFLQIKFQDFIQKGIPAIGLYLMTQWKKIGEWYKTIIAWLGLETSPDVIATEIADYYAESRAAVSKLPFV